MYKTLGPIVAGGSASAIALGVQQLRTWHLFCRMDGRGKGVKPHKCKRDKRTVTKDGEKVVIEWRH